MLPPVFVELKANVSEFTAAMGEARTEMTSVEAQGVSSFDKLASFGKAALFGLGAAAVGVGVLGVQMADTFEASHAKLETALKNAGFSFDQFSSQIDVAQKSMEAYGYTNAQTQEALANLTTATKDPKKALDDLSLAADLAKYKHIDLADAATAVARASEGNTRALKQLGIDLPVASTNAAQLAKAHDALSAATDKASAFLKVHSDAVDSSSKYHAAYETLLGKVSAAQQAVNDKSSAGTEIMKGLADAIGGQAAAQAETFSGKMQALKATSEDVAKNIGMALIPILEQLALAIKSVIDWFTQHKAIAEAVGIVIGTVLVAAIGAYLVSLATAAVESTINFAKMVAGWVATGAAATAAGIETAIATGGLTIAIGLVVAAIAYLATHWSETWDGIKSVTEGAWNFIDGIIQKIGSGIRTYIGIIKSEINAVISLINTVIRAIDSVHVSIPSWVPGIGGKSFGVDIPEIPMLANGGIVTSPTLAMIGEAGSEAVIPLSKMGGMGGINVVVNVQGSVVQEQDLAISVRDQIAILMRRRGLNPSILGV
jgi:hypothetical protein